MSQKNPPKEKRAPKAVPKSQQYLDDIARTKKRREQNQHKKALKEQGVGSTIPASHKSAARSADMTAEDSPDEDFDPILAEAQAYEATLNSLCAKIATHYAVCFKDLRMLDEEELQEIWDNGPLSKATRTVKALETSGSQQQTSQVQSVGPVQRILSTPALSTTERSAKKRKRPSSALGPRLKAGKSDDTNQNGKRPRSKGKKGAKSHTDKVVSVEDDSTDGSSGGSESDEDKGGDDEDNEGEGSNTEDGGHTKVKGKRGKTSNFSGIVKKMVDFTTIQVCAKLTATGMFCSAHKYTSLVYRSWKHSAAGYGVNVCSAKYKLQKRHRQAIHRRVNSFCSQIRDCLKPVIVTTYLLVLKGLTPDKAKACVQKLLPHAYHTKVGAPQGTGHFQHDFLPDAVFKSYFTGLNPVGIVYKKWFNPMPLPVIALVCAIIVWVIHRHKSGRYVVVKMTFEQLCEYYTEIMDSLKAFQTGRQADRCLYVQNMLYIGSL